MTYEKSLLDFIVKYIRENYISIEEVPSLMDKIELDILQILCQKEDTVYVLKKRTGVEQFDFIKLKRSIENVSDEINQPLNASEVDNIVKFIRESIKKDNLHIIESMKIRTMLVSRLKEIGYDKLADHYEKFYKA